MANADTPFGLRPVRHLDGSTYNGQTERFYIPSSDSTAYGVGVPVKLAGSADSRGVPTVIVVGVTDAPLGVITSFERDPDNLSLTHRLASTARYCNVCVSPDVVYEAQEDSVGGALVAGDTGKVIRVALGTVDTVSGYQSTELDSSSATTTGEPFRLLRLVDREDNEFGTEAKWEVCLNELNIRE